MSLVQSLSSTPGLERLQQQRQRLQALREEARYRFTHGLPVLQTTSLICANMDKLVIGLVEEALQGLSAAQRDSVMGCSSLIAVGGTGRGELAPYSDVDLLFLQESAADNAFTQAIPQVVRACWDSGIQIGHRIATILDALGFARKDPVFATALVEMRLLWGSERVFGNFKSRFNRRVARGRYNDFYQRCRLAREAERRENGDTDRKLEPDVKKSPGGMRDIQLVRWIGYALCETPDLDLLRYSGYLSREDCDQLLAAHSFLMRVRTELHFHAGKAQEILTRDEQLRIADVLGYKDTDAQRGVEIFMRQYFLHATNVTDVVNRFVERHRPRQWVDRIVRKFLARRDNEYFLAVGNEIFPAPRYEAGVLADPDRLFQLYELAAGYDARVPADFSDKIKSAVQEFPQPAAPSVARRFLSILKTERGLGRILREMFSNAMLEYVLPEMRAIRCLLQFNQYHSYTVDEHTFRAIEAVEERRNAKTGLGKAIREIKAKEILHLTLLLHDAGKGHVEDHSILGERIARLAGERLCLESTQTETIAFLVRHHLDMTLLAFRRDVHDVSLQIEFARQMGNAETMKMLYVHTAADMLAVGPNTFTGWKEDLLTQLYHGSMERLSGSPQDSELDSHRATIVQHLRENQVLSSLEQATSATDDANTTSLDNPDLLRELVDGLPAHYLAQLSVTEIADDLAKVNQLASQPLLVNGVYDKESGTVEYRVITQDRSGSGLFSKICGTLTAKGMSILSANICTTSQNVAIDRFRVIDGDFSGVTPPYRLREIEQTLRDVLVGGEPVDELFRKNRRLSVTTAIRIESQVPPRVVADNLASESATVIDVFARDGRGLLYTIAKSLFELSLSIQLAKITTHVDQVLDVFYVTTMDGRKLQNSEIPAIETQLLQRVEEFERSLRPR